MNRRIRGITAILMPASPGGHRRLAALLTLSLITAFGCSRSGTKFEIRENGEWHQAPWELTQTRIQRDGSEVLAHFVFEAPDDQRVLLESHVTVDPQVSFVSGSWTHVRGSVIVGTGALQASSFDFLGGQGGRPSIGGHFELRENDGTPRYRATIAPAEAKVVTWPGS